MKNDAYGLGLVGMATLLMKEGVKKFCCIHLEEALMLRDLSKDIQILLLGPIPYDEIDLIRENDIIVSLNQANEIAPSGVNVAYKVNTNLNRFGMDIKDVPKDAKMVYSHLAIDDPIVAKNFLDYGFIYSHIGSSKLLMGSSVRVGFRLFTHAISIMEEIIYIRDVMENSYIGYNYFTKEKKRVGIINCGYYHGLSTRNEGRMVYIRGKYYPILSICMNQAIIEIDDTIRIRDEVELIGAHIPLEDAANYLGLSPYEVLISFHKMAKHYQ